MEWNQGQEINGASKVVFMPLWLKTLQNLALSLQKLGANTLLDTMHYLRNKVCIPKWHPNSYMGPDQK